MFIDERLANTNFPLPAIREVNLAKHKTGISLGLGELKNFKVDDQIYETLCKNWHSGGSSYTQNAGLPVLREAVANKQKRLDGFDYNTDNVVITIGVQNAIYTSIKTLHKLGAKRVLIPSIHFGIYKKIPAEFNMEVICYPLNDDFSINLAALSHLIQSDDVLILNSPSNPTGKVFNESELRELANLLNQQLSHGYVISDEIYASLVYEGEAHQSFSKYFERTIIADGISKSGAAAGLRVGWLITRNKQLAKAFTSNNATIISTPPTNNQFAAIPVVEGKTLATINEYQNQLKANRDLVVRFLNKHQIPFEQPRGSFYIFPKLDGIVPASQIKEFCIETASMENGVVVIPGIAFGAEEYIRISLATDQMEEGLKRLEKAIFQYK
ncbi:MAG: pyridoxal phosphate-dependent aminotransferase [Carboxylicivirga sp.]|jgi:aspartate aminotransferase|nr:pyridoxal phosphate-dependent aminotransferase [Carboxylicivirga sp.]